MDQIERDVDEIVSQYISELTPGCSLLAAKGGEVLFRKAYGLADVENNIRIEPEDNFIIASNTKQFTCLAVLMLQSRGLLALDEKIDRFFPGLPDCCSNITIRMLMTHTSGIPDYFDIDFEKNEEKLRKADAYEMLLIAKGFCGKLLFEPDTDFSYSNTAYIMLGDIIRQTSGMSFGSFIENEILRPVGMDRSYAPDYMDSKDPYQVEGYEEQTGSSGEHRFVKVPYDMLEVGYADGNISSNVDDILKWHGFLYGKGRAELYERMVSREILAQMYTPHRLKDGREIPYGLGIMTGSFDEHHYSIEGHRELWHTGGTMGFISRVSYLSDDDISLIMLTNRNGIARDDLFMGFAGAVLSNIDHN